MRITLFLLLFFPIICFSQSNGQKLIEGTVYNDESYSIEGVHVLNITSNYNTITDADCTVLIALLIDSLGFPSSAVVVKWHMIGCICVRIACAQPALVLRCSPF